MAKKVLVRTGDKYARYDVKPDAPGKKGINFRTHGRSQTLLRSGTRFLTKFGAVIVIFLCQKYAWIRLESH